MSRASGLARQRRELTKLWLTYRIPLIAVVVLIALLIAGKIMLDERRAAVGAEREAAIERAARGAVSAVVKRVGTLAERIRAVDSGPLIAAIDAGDPAGIEALTGAMQQREESLIRAWLLAPDRLEPDYDSTPPLGYAALDLLRGVGDKGTVSNVEAILFGEPGEHVAIARALRGADDALAGYLLWALDVAVAKSALAGVDVGGGFAALTQRVAKGQPLTLATAGNPGARSGPAALTSPVRGSTWSISYWPPVSIGQQVEGGVPWIAVGGGAALLLALAAGGLVWRRRSAASAPEPVEPAPVNPEAGGFVAPEGGEPAPAAVVVEEGGGEPSESGEEAGEADAVALPESIFRAYDVRGVVGDTLSEDIVRRIGAAIGSEAFERGQQTVAVGYDGRSSSPDLSAALIEGLRGSGRDVIDVGRVPTPVLYFATHFFDTGSGVMVTGSHNPPQYNGLKIMLAGDALFGDDIQALRARVAEGKLTTGRGSLQSMEIIDDYIRRVSEDIPVALGSSQKVVVDCGNGVAGDVAPKLLRALGHDVVDLFCEVDGNFPNHHPDPANPDNLVALIDKVRETGADLGLAFDGDGDRLGVVDPRGNIIWPDRQMMLYARDVLSRNAGAEIVFDVKCTSRLPKVITKLGGKPVMWKTGHSFIKGKLKESGAPLAGEMSGHIFFKDRWYGFDDGIYAAARLLEILVGLKMKPVDVFAKLPDGVSTPELRVDLAEGAQIEFMQRLLAAASFDDGKTTTIDGLRVDFADSWGLVRASNTTPSLVLRFEADDAAALDRVQQRFRELLLGVDADLQLPF